MILVKWCSNNLGLCAAGSRQKRQTQGILQGNKKAACFLYLFISKYWFVKAPVVPDEAGRQGNKTIGYLQFTIELSMSFINWSEAQKENSKTAHNEG